jgi:hypothetical protein
MTTRKDDNVITTSTLSRKQILQADDIQQQLVDVPEWGGQVLVRGLTGAERDRFEAGVLERKGKHYNVNMANIRAKLVAATCIDGDGQLLFGDDDVPLLAEKSGLALQRVFEVAQQLSGLSETDLEELAGN